MENKHVIGLLAASASLFGLATYMNSPQKEFLDEESLLR